MKGIKLKALTFGLISSMILGTISPIFASDSVYSVENQTVSEEGTFETKVYAQIGSKFLVTIPKSLTLSGIDKKGEYKVSVSGDMAGNELIKVVPDSFLMLSSINKETVIGLINQNKIEWTYKDKTDGTGIIDANDITAGKWNGIFNFNIKSERPQILMSVAKNQNNEEVEIKTESIAGVEKNDLLSALEQSGQIESGEDIETIVNVSTTTDIDKIEIDVSGVAKPGDTIVVVQEKTDEWDYVSTETVDNNNKITVDVTNSNPVSFIETKPDGSIHVHVYEEKVAQDATCTTDGVLLMACECDRSYSFTIPASHDIELVEKKDENGELINKYYECKNCDYSILNLTKLFSGEEISHTCSDYLTTKYDTTNHWKECTACGAIFNKVTHTYVDNGWTLGSASKCETTNVHKFTCDCGYSYTTTTGRASHSTTNTNHYMSATYYKACSKCKSSVETIHNCIKSDGSRIACNNLGTCKLCGFNYTASTMAHVTTSTDPKTINGNLYCRTCNKYLAKINYINVTSQGLNKVKVDSSITVTSGMSYTSVSNWAPIVFTYSNTPSISGTTWKCSTVITLPTNTGINVNTEAPKYNGKINGQIVTMICYGNTKSEYNAPVISSITQTSIGQSNDWSKGNEVTISGTEDFCKTVTLKVKDSENNTYYSGTINVTNKNWTYTFVPDIEADEAVTLTATVTDAIGNTSSKTFTVSKTDKKAPTPNINTTISTEWSKTKDYTFTAIDEGAGDVKIAFNNINEYVDMTKSGTTYTKDYQFSGDVYGEVTAAIYYKDAIGNTATQFVKIHNLDNTAPTITNYSLDGKTITIEANDLNSELNLEGSGITGYALTWSPAQPQETDWQSSNQIQISGSGIYYLWAKDLVGNVSKPYKIKIIL